MPSPHGRVILRWGMACVSKLQDAEHTHPTVSLGGFAVGRCVSGAKDVLLSQVYAAGLPAHDEVERPNDLRVKKDDCCGCDDEPSLSRVASCECASLPCMPSPHGRVILRRGMACVSKLQDAEHTHPTVSLGGFAVGRCVSGAKDVLLSQVYAAGLPAHDEVERPNDLRVKR